MRVEENEGGGISVIVEPGESLRKVPKSHVALITPQLREAFADPPSYFGRVAARCPFRSMSLWLRTLIAGGDWEKVLHRGVPPVPMEWTAVGIRWWSETVRSAEITPSNGHASPDRPRALSQYFSLVDAVSWMPFACAGGLYGTGNPTPLTEFYYTYHGADIDPAQTFVLGQSPCGDMLIYTQDGRGGWLGHENGKIRLLGTIEETIEWVYAELQANRCPEFDYNRG